jgi:hypothetical protein
MIGHRQPSTRCRTAGWYSLPGRSVGRALARALTGATRMQRLLSYFSYPVLILLTLVLGLAPFAPEPHLVEKLRMLRQGTLTRPLDVFDLFFHLLPAILLLLKLSLERPWRRR